MYEFNNRISAQRQILNIVNQKHWTEEKLIGLTQKAIDRWISVNSINPQSPFIETIKNISEKLFFLANKSQEHITDSYKIIKDEITELANKLVLELK